jgi:hypothetical protein
MFDTAWRHTVDDFWADALGCERALLHEPGVHVVGGGQELAAYRGLYLLRLDATLLVFAPPTVRAQVETRVGDARGDPLGLFTRDGAARLADGAGRVLGPSRHHYADRAHVVARDDAVRELSGDDLPLVDGLRQACSDGDWEEGGFGHAPARRFGVVEREVLVAAGSLTEWRGTFSDVGLVTHPAHRARGHARSLTRAMTRRALQTTDVVRYRALTTNAASLAVARGEGFAPYGENLAVRLAT